MAEETLDPLREQLEEWIGKNLNMSGPAIAPDTVNMPMIRHWIDAFDDRNPVYEDAEFAATTRFGGTIAPPAMLQSWTMARPVIEGMAERGGVAIEIDPNSPLITLDNAGFNATLATNSELEFVRPLREGDLLESDVVVEAISERKKTGLGLGYFVTWVSTYRDQHGEVVGRQRFRILKFNPGTAGEG
jgi:acyl dehydratase